MRMDDVAWVTFSTIGWAIALFTIITFLEHFSKLRRLQSEERENLEQQLDEAIATTHSIRFPVALVSADTFYHMGELKPHEELRDLRLMCGHAISQHHARVVT